ncbi:hypothetical protein BDZ90DRAFT_40842 [Jaminaea rosea]|uniref:Uncharacterized protein n=1 Tax=Jaminaea rosea TaxID=1569628 RepID=A0A316UMN5_9BASI|nr:hypothetical protein BDZ90DRAFT_40842 [Jaminaea rosea]PWN26537.1 hypothetical protein BDZ90DRAFT_40842 [Jaminaea rosea]
MSSVPANPAPLAPFWPSLLTSSPVFSSLSSSSPPPSVSKLESKIDQRFTVFRLAEWLSCRILDLWRDQDSLTWRARVYASHRGDVMSKR